MKSENKFCVTCKHYIPAISVCQSPRNGISLVSGEPKAIFANMNRADNNMCGESANFWEAKNEEKKSTTSFFGSVRKWFKT